MAKRYKGKRKSSKCPEPFNTLIDLAGGIAMNAIASNMEEKHHYRKSGVPNPYRVTAFGFATGRINKTEDIIRLGGLMGAMGSFDDDPYEVPRRRRLSDNTITQAHNDNNRNKYAWRLNCEDGTPYGLSPMDYETREEYNAALTVSRDSNQQPRESLEDITTSEGDDCATVERESTETFFYCKVSRLDNGRNQYFRVSTTNIPIGKQVTCVCDGKNVAAIVLSVQLFPKDQIPAPLDSIDLLMIE